MDEKSTHFEGLEAKIREPELEKFWKDIDERFLPEKLEKTSNLVLGDFLRNICYGAVEIFRKEA